MLLNMVNALFDEIKRKNQLSSDAALARYLKVNEMAILRWRRGAYPKGLEIIGPQILEYADVLRQPAA